MWNVVSRQLGLVLGLPLNLLLPRAGQMLECPTRICGGGTPWEIGLGCRKVSGQRQPSQKGFRMIHCSPNGRQSTRVVEALTHIAFGR